MPRGIDSSDTYLETLVKNMPSETVAGYLATIGLVSAADDAPAWALWFLWGVFLVATPFYLWLVRPKTERETAPPRPWWQVWIFSPISFFVWSMTIGGPWASIDKAAFAGGILVIVLSVVIFPLASMGIARATA